MAKKAGFKRWVSPHTWLLRHAQVMLYSLGRLMRRPLSTLLTAMVIGIAISLPVGLHTLVGNVQTISSSWQGASSLSVFLKKEVAPEQRKALVSSLEARSDIDQISYISPEQALEEFRQFSGFSDALDLLEENPIPPVLLVKPSTTHSTPELTEKLTNEIRLLPEVEMAQADLQWVRRFQGMTQIIQQGAIVLTVMLGLAVILIMGNTIRLEIQSRQKEIEVTKLVGGTNAFIRRPFLYEGFWYGLMGGGIACLLILTSFSLLSGPVSHLAGLYQSNFALDYLPLMNVLMILLGSTLLGLAGSWLAVKQHLNAIEPA